MRDSSDITFTLLVDQYDSYRVTPNTKIGAEFVANHIPGDQPERTVSATDQKRVTEKAHKCGLAVRVE